MRNLSLLLGRPRGVELRLHLSFALLLMFILLLETTHGGVAAVERGLYLFGIMFGSVALHELAHVIVSLKLGLPVRGIMLLPLGGVSLLDPHSQAESARNFTREARVAVAGPLVTAVLALLAAGVFLMRQPLPALWATPLVSIHNLPQSFFWSNIFLLGVNLLPAFPMDAGRVFRARLTQTMEFQQATRKAVNFGHLFAALFMFFGVVFSPWLMLLGLFIFMAAQMEERTVMFQSVVEAVRLEDIMLTEFSTLSPADTLEDALERAVHSLQDDFPVVRGGDLVGVINKQTIVEKLRREGNGYVQSAMSKAFEVASRSESLASAFRKLSTRGLTLIPVADEGLLVGIVTLQNLMHSMGLLAESRRLKRQTEE